MSNDWERDELRSARRHSERHTPVQHWAERDRATDGAAAEADEQKREKR
ncbi:hypothetical protein [Isoptericola sp. NPDC055881]